MNHNRLILMRHAKSSWANVSQADFDRPLNERGRQAAPLMGRWLDEQGLIPDLILCSTARRTQETCDLLLGFLESKDSENRLLGPLPCLA